MTYLETTTHVRKGKHLNFSERKMIEAWKSLDTPLSNRAIAKKLGRAPQTIHKEVKDGTVKQIKRQTHNGTTYEYASFVYSADAGQAHYEKARLRSRKQPKWMRAPTFMAYADVQMTRHKHSPDAVVGRARRMACFSDEPIPCTTTLYKYIQQGLMRTSPMDLLLKLRRKTTVKRNRINRRCLGDSIDMRPDVINTRARFGDWEIDTVIGQRSGNGAVLLTLTERFTRYELVMKLPNKTAAAVNHALHGLNESLGVPFHRLFRTITSDNGTEFSALSDGVPDATHIYYTHPYSSWERGTNEHHNGIIRRFIPKGKTIDSVSERTIKRVQDWMNRLPRKSLNYATPEERFLEEVTKQGILQSV